MVQTSGFRQKFYTTFSGNFSMYLFTPDKKYIQLKFDIVAKQISTLKQNFFKLSSNVCMTLTIHIFVLP